MLKKLLKGCLTIALVSAMAIPAMADMKVNGRAVGEFLNVSTKSGSDSVSYMDMASEGRLGAKFSATEGDWTVTAVSQLRAVNSRVTSGAATSAFDNLYNYVTLENASMKFALGKQWWGLCYMSGTYTGYTVDRYCYGTNNVAARDDRLLVTLKDIGLTVLVEMNVNNQSNDSTTDAYKQTAFGFNYSKAMDALNLTVEYTSVSRAADEKLDAGSKDNADDGYAASELVLGVTYMLNDKTELNFHYDNFTSKEKAAADPSTTSVMGLGAEIGLSESSGVSLAYDMGSTKVGTSTTSTTSMVANFVQKFAGVPFFVGYLATTEKNDDAGIDNSGSTLAVGGYVEF